MFIDARIQLAGLMGLLPNQKFNVVETDEPLTILNMNLEVWKNLLYIIDRINCKSL